jgi:nucleotide-binding universal stress UspA family protein
MIRDIVVNLSINPGPDVARDYAVTVARAFDAHLTAVAFAYEPVELGTIFNGVAASLIDTQRRDNEQAAKKAAAEFDAVARGAALSAEPRVLSSTAAGCADTFAQIARSHDLAIVAQVEPEGRFPEDVILETALFDSGRPLLVVPYIQKEPFKVDRVLLCWDGSRSAARATADALPLLGRSKNVEIITIATRDERGEIPGADIGHHLARHKVKVDLKRLVAPDTDVPNTILSHAADFEADLIVMGGYGHSRLREFILGGATKGILASMTVPTLMSH